MRVRVKRPSTLRASEEAAPAPEVGSKLSPRRFLKALAAVGAVGLAELAVSPKRAEAAYHTGPPDYVDTQLDVQGTIRSTSQVAPTSGSGVELLFTNGQGYLFPYTRPSGPYLPLVVTGAPLYLNPGGGNLAVGGSAVPATTLDVNGTIRATNQVVPTSGEGTELVYAGGAGYVTAYDRDHRAGLPLVLNMLSGNVGVGTTGPGQSLDVNGWIQTEGSRMIINGFDGAPGWFWLKSAYLPEAQAVAIGILGKAGYPPEAVEICPGGPLGIHVQNGGNVGVGTNQPASPLDVNGVISVKGAAAIDGTGTAVKAYYS